MNFSHSFGTTPMTCVSNFAEGSSVDRRSTFENIQAVLYDITHHKAEVETYFAAYPDSVPLIHSVLPPAEHCNLPTPPAQTPDLQATNATNKPSGLLSDEPSTTPPPAKRTRPSKRKQPNKRKHPSKKKRSSKGELPGNAAEAYKRALTSANCLPQELGSVNVLTELQRNLQQQRAQTYHSTQKRQQVYSDYILQGEQEMDNALETKNDDFCKPQVSLLLVTALERYRRMRIAQLYATALRNKERRRYSLAEEFVEKYLEDYFDEWKHLPKAELKDKLQNKWKQEIRHYKFWVRLVETFSAGVLLLLPEEFQDEHARLLGNEDRAAIVANIAAAHQNLKEDLADLTNLLSYFYSKKALPEWHLVLETLDAAEIAASPRNCLRRLLSVGETATPIAVQRGDPVMQSSVQPINQHIGVSVSGNEYTEDQPTRFPSISPVGEQVDGPQLGPEAVLEGPDHYMVDTSGFDYGMQERSYTEMLMSADQLQLFNLS